jgi:NAD(P)-dependent dehydrogenase (short-subunit alcohol dehydrogenase family)
MILKNKTVFITGGAKRVGSEIALYFAKMGANVCIHYNTSKKEALALKEKCISYGVLSEIYQADLQNVKLSVEAISNAISDFQKVHFLINNASIFEKNSIKNITEKEFDRDFAIQTKTPLFLMQEFAKQNFENEEGFILNMLDKNIMRKNTKFISYLLSKKSLHELTQFAAFELAPQIRVNSICLGFILEEAGIKASEFDEYYAKKIENIPLKRKGNVQDVITAIDFLVKSTYITGENITIDGGSFLNI